MDQLPKKPGIAIIKELLAYVLFFFVVVLSWYTLLLFIGSEEPKQDTKKIIEKER